MLAFHGDPKIKSKYLARVRAHAKADRIIKGVYWEDWKGCAVGCTIHSSSHSAYEVELGIPVALAYLEDRVFENLPNELAKTWPARFLSAIKPGADLSLVSSSFLHWLLTDPEGILSLVQGDQFTAQRNAINAVAALYVRRLSGDEPSQTDWAWAADVAAWAADVAAWAADVAAWAAEAVSWSRMASKLLQLLKASGKGLP